MSDDEWVFFEAFITAIRGRGGRPATDHRLVLDGVFWITRTGAPWRDLPEEFGKWFSVYRQFRRWTLAGLWELILAALNESEAVPDTVQMIDSTIIRAHHCAAGAKEPAPDPRSRRGQALIRGGLKKRVLAVQKVASRPKSTSSRTALAYP